MSTNTFLHSLTVDLSNTYQLLNSTFRAFFSDQTVKDFNSKRYYEFTGISEQEIHKLFSESNIKNLISHNASPYDIFILLCCIIPYYYPDAYRGINYLKKLDESSFTILGGNIVGDNKCFYPTGETILFLMSGHDIAKRINVESFLEADSLLFRLNFLDITSSESNVPRLAGQLYPTSELLTLIQGKTFRPEYSSNFPASRIETKMDWDDLVLPYETHEDLEELKIWMEHGKKLISHADFGKRIKPGYRTLFYGPPGTGKTLTASLIGKSFGVDVYRIDLSMVVSKWVGETEKNLKGIFDLATNKSWILFFDEADSLFGKRTNTNSSNDRYANQEVSYLLQRIEDFPGLVILASNLKSNIDEAFNRRFQSAILFPMPDAEIRYILWKKAFPADFPLESKVDLLKIAEKYEMAGGAIINIVRYCVLKSMERDNQEILLDDIEHAIIREFKKEGKIVS